MRYYSPLRDPDRRQSRQRTVVRGVRPTAQWGQRPMFTRADEEQEPAGGPDAGMAPEARLDDLVPADEGPTSEARAVLVGANVKAPVFITHSKDNVGNPPSAEEIQIAFGPRETGFIGFIIDAGGAGKCWLCIKFSTYWHYVGMTRAV